jgi:glycosyltransferase involved in cell wall biosynthesis
MLAPISAAGVTVEEVPVMPDRSGALRTPRFARTLRALKPAIFHAHLTCPGACKFGMAGAIAANVPGIIATVHAFPDVALTRLAAIEWSLMASRVDRFLVASHHGQRSLRAALPSSAGRTSVVPNGIDVSRYRRPPDAGLRAQLAGDADRRLVLVCARLDPEKGHATLVQACHAMPNVQLVFAGAGAERASLERLAVRLGMRERVSFLGFRTDVAELLAACDVMVLPTRNEAFGLVLLEAMAAGRPVISTRVGGPEEIVVDGESGLLVPRDDVSGLSSALRAVLDDPALAARLATGGRSRVEAEFSDTAVTARTVGIYEDVLAKRRIRAA